MPYNDQAKRKAYLKLWRARNIDRERARGRAVKCKSYAANPEKYRSRKRLIYAECPAKAKKLVYHRRDEILKWFRELCKQRQLCCPCGVSSPECLDFHHLRDKDGNIATCIRSKGWSKERVLRELEKCQVLCANCHRTVHRNKRPSRPHRSWVWDYKVIHPCPCGENRPQCLDFHHRDPSKKSGEISEMIARCYPMDTILAEIEKCDIHCANCHRSITHICQHDQS